MALPIPNQPAYVAPLPHISPPPLIPAVTVTHPAILQSPVVVKAAVTAPKMHCMPMYNLSDNTRLQKAAEALVLIELDRQGGSSLNDAQLATQVSRFLSTPARARQAAFIAQYMS